MLRIPALAHMDITDRIKLGGAYTPQLIGITPRDLIPGNPAIQRIIPQPNWPGHRNNLPEGLRRNSPDALIRQNWRRFPGPDIV